MIMWSLEPAEEIIKKLYWKNPRRSISGTLKFIRKQQRFSMFGDYPILCKILQNLKGIDVSSWQLNYAFSKSEEFQYLTAKEKKEVRQQLFQNLYVAKNKRVDSSRKVENL